MRHFSLILGLFLILIALLFPRLIQADVINPEWFDKKCGISEREVVCSYTSREPFGPRIYDDCQKYKYNPNYRYLVGRGSSFGGSEKYCTNLPLLVNVPLITHHDVLEVGRNFLLTLIIELLVFSLLPLKIMGLRKAVVLANLVSVPLFYLVVKLLGGGFIVIVAGEIGVIILETTMLASILKVPNRNIVGAVILANLSSAIFGGMILFILPFALAMMR
jgi:hypothetical protein